MSHHTLPEARQLEQLLKEKLIPFAQNGAPLVWLDTPPRSSVPLDITETTAAPLELPRRRKPYPGFHVWRRENINSLGVPIIGCVFQGEMDYDVRDRPGAGNRRWIVPLREGVLYVVKPNTPVTASKLPWERPAPLLAYARGLYLHMRRDGVSCRTYTIDKGRSMGHHYVFMQEFESHLLAERLVQELSRAGEINYPILYHYLALIFHLLLRSLKEKQYTYAFGISPLKSYEEEPPVGTPEIPAAETSSGEILKLARRIINENLTNPELTCHSVAEKSGVSQQYLNRLMREAENKTLLDYLHEKRFEKACALLANPELTVAQVGEYCGFRRTSHFSSWFAKRAKNSPRDFRSHE